MASLTTPLRYKHRLFTTEGNASQAADVPRSGGQPVALKDRLCTYLEIAPFVFLLASAENRGRQCTLELVHVPLDAGGAGRPTSRRAGEPLLDEQAAGSAAALPPALRAAFRIPKIIELDTEDEGVITTLELVPDVVRSFMRPPKKDTSAAKDAVSPLADRRTSGMSASTTAVDLDTLHLHLFIGTSNGTVLVANAIRGTLLVLAQFQYHHDMLRRRHVGTEEEGDGTTSAVRPMTVSGSTRGSNTSGRDKVNQTVVRFLAHYRSADSAWNPSLLNVASPAGSASPADAPTDAMSSVSSPVPTMAAPDAVYVVHSGGKIVRLDRRVLDVFVRVCVNRLDGRRPHLSLEWVTATTSTAYPIAGPALDCAAFVQFVYTTPAPAHYSDAEKRTAGAGGVIANQLVRDAHLPGRVIHDAAFFTAPCSATSLVAPLVEHNLDSAGVLLCGRFPAFAAYLLEQQRDEFSASKAVKAVATAVTGMAKNLWRSAIGTPAQPAPLPHLAKRPQGVEAGMFAPDTTMTSVLVDPTNEWAALGCEGSGRIYLVELSTGVVCRVLKGCRAAQFHWTRLALLGKRLSALVVYLPLRNLVEVHTVRLRGRIAACHVDSGAVLLRPAASPRRATATNSTSISAAYALLMAPSGDIQHLHIDLTALERQIRQQQQAQHGDRAAGQGGTYGDESGTSLVSHLLSSCRTPDDFFDTGLQIPLPEGPFFTATPAATTAAADATVCGSRYDEAAAFKFRAYKRSVGEVCEALKRRFAPSYCEPRTISLPPHYVSGTPVEEQALQRSLSAAQCLNYLQLRSRLIECYARLLMSTKSTAVASATAEVQMAKQWCGVVATPLWSSRIADTQSPVSQKFWNAAVEAWCSAHQAPGGEWAPLRNMVLSCLKRAGETAKGQPPSPSGGAVKETGSSEEEGEQVSPRQFLSYFYCGDDKPKFLYSHNPHAPPSLAEEERRCYCALARLFFAGGSVQAFAASLTDITALGLNIGDLACITVLWLYRACCRSLPHFLTTNNLGALCFVLQLFPDAAVVTSVSQVALELSVSSDATSSASKMSTADGIAGLLLTVLARQHVKPINDDAVTHCARLLVEQLVGLHVCIESSLFSEGHLLGGFIVSPERLLPHPSAVDNDTLDSLYLHSGASLGRASALSKRLPRARAEKGATTFDFLLLEDAILQLVPPQGCPPTAHVNPTSTRVTPADGWPWLKRQSWNAEDFTTAVIDPLRSQWRESEPAGTTTRRPESEKWALFSQCCVLAYAMTAVDRVVQPLADPMLTFWDFNSVPASNFLERAQRGVSGDGLIDRRWLVGQDATRAYLCSVRDVALFTQSCARSIFGRHADARRVVTVIQTIAACLAADDELAFPLVPRTARRGLKFLMHMSGFNAELLPYRLTALLSLLQLLIFWVDLSSLGAAEASLAAIRKLSVPWRDLYGMRDSFFVIFPAALSDPRTSANAEVTFTASLGTYDAHMTVTSATAASILARGFVAAFEPTEALSPAASEWLDSHVLSSGVDRLSAALGLQDIAPGFSRLVLLDAMVKRLRAPEQLAPSLVSIPDRGLAARVTMRDLGAILACILKYFSQQKKQFAKTQQRERFDELSLRMNGVLTLMSQPCRQWVKSLLPGSAESHAVPSHGDAPADDGSTMSLERAVVGGTTSWFSAGEMDALYARVDRTLRLPSNDVAKESFFELLFQLAQLSVEGKSRLSREERCIVDEMPGVAEGSVAFLR